MLQSAVHTVVASVMAESSKEELSAALVERMTGGVHSALDSLGRAQAWEMDQHASVSIASHIMEQINRRLLQLLGQPQQDPSLPDHPVRLAVTDYYFLGLMFFVIERTGGSRNAPCPSDQIRADPLSETAEDSQNVPAEGLLSSLLYKELSRHQIPRGANHLETSERLLRIGAGRELRYWPSFALGRTLYFEGKYSEAELAFSTCASLRPEYARSYEQRALMLALQAAHGTDEYQRARLRELALEDSERALTLAERARDPSTWWPRGDLLVLIGQPDRALHAYTQAMERDDSIREKVNRRNNLVCVRKLALSQIEQADAARDALADANAVLALASMAQDDTAESRQEARNAAERALQLDANHPYARTARGLLAVHEAQEQQRANHDSDAQQAWTQALKDFDQALRRAPDSYQAARGRALALEYLARPADALQAWSYLIETDPQRAITFGNTIALTDAQLSAAHLGRARALERLHRSNEAQEALAAARQLAPAATERSSL
jgi:tetratricopeptide (TPR) repeat protein